MGWPNTVLKISNLLAASSTGIGAVSTAGGGTTSFNVAGGATLDQARRITVTCASCGGQNFTITGTNATGEKIIETALASSLSGTWTATTTQDFLTVTSVAISCSVSASSGGFLIGTTTNAGSPWQVFDTTRVDPYLGFNIVPTSSLTQTSLEYTNDYPYFNPLTGLWDKCAFPTRGPQPTISSLGSSVIGPGANNGYINFPIVAWRITLSASSSGIGTTAVSAVQSGV